MSEGKLHGAEKREVRAPRVDIFKPLPRLERRSATGEYDIFGEWWAVFHADAEVFADGVVDR